MATPIVETMPPAAATKASTPSPYSTRTLTTTRNIPSIRETPTTPRNPAEEDINLALPPPIKMCHGESLTLEPLSPGAGGRRSPGTGEAASIGLTAPTAFDHMDGMIKRSVALYDNESEDELEEDDAMVDDFENAAPTVSPCDDDMGSTTSTVVLMGDKSTGNRLRKKTRSYANDIASAATTPELRIPPPTSSSASATTVATSPLTSFRPAARPFTKEETLLLVDWDDTLLPSTWLARNKLRLDDESIVNEEQRILLNGMAESARRMLTRSMQYGTVVIVTNAEKGWIELSCQKFMPSLYSLVSTIRILSARSTFEPLGFTTPREWKEQAFEQVIQDFYSSNSNLRRNVLSFGDSSHEREALLEVCSNMNGCKAKSVKFQERPEIEQLQKEHTLLLESLSGVVSTDQQLDLCVQTT